MLHPPTLQGTRVTLRALVPADRQDRLACGRDREFVYLCGGNPHALQPLTPAEADGWYRAQRAEPFCWAIEYRGRCIGSCRLHSLEPLDRRARYAIGLFDRSVWSQGLGTEATRLVLAHAFRALGLHRVDLRVLADNPRAIACYQKCGFVVEGRERESVCIAGAWHDDLLMSVLCHEFRADTGAA